MSIFRIKIDFGPKGTTKSDEIFCDGFSISWPELLEEDLQNHQAEVAEKIKDRQFFVDQRLFCGMFCLLGTIDASAVREMNL